MLIEHICFSASYIFIIIMWKKQALNACFNLFLVLLLSLNSVAVFDRAIQKNKAQRKIISEDTIKYVLSKFFMSS